MSVEYQKLNPVSLEPKIDGLLYKITTHPSGTAVREVHYEFEIRLTVNKPSIVADGIDTATITATIYNYLDELQTASVEPVIFEIEGVTSSPIAPVNGQASITVTSAVVDSITIRSAVPTFRNGEIEVTAV